MNHRYHKHNTKCGDCRNSRELFISYEYFGNCGRYCDYNWWILDNGAEGSDIHQNLRFWVGGGDLRNVQSGHPNLEWD